MSETSKYETALLTPSDVYRHPGAVINDIDLNDQQKREILKHWEAEAVHLQDSESEGMEGGEKSLLPEIKRALLELK